MTPSTKEISDPVAILQKLTSLPHRGVGSRNAERAAAVIAEILKKGGADVTSQAFPCPKTYLPMVWWLVGGMVFGLLLAGVRPWPAFFVTVVFAGMGAAYFDWRPTPLPYLVPRVRGENIIASQGSEIPGARQTLNKIILMAHYDTAPISYIYLTSMVSGFRRSLRISVGLMLLSPAVILLEAIEVFAGATPWVRYALIAYFLIQVFLSSIDFYRYGYSNGAADNASGVAAAIVTAQRLWRNPVDGYEVELVLTSGEEVGMVGARAYLKEQNSLLDRQNTFLFNFDNVGAGKLKIITETGSLSSLRYDNRVVKAAVRLAGRDPRFAEIDTAGWHIGDFDSIWFERAGIPSLTLSAQDDMGLIPNLHRPEDTLDHVDPALVFRAAEFAVAVIDSIRQGGLETSTG